MLDLVISIDPLAPILIITQLMRMPFSISSLPARIGVMVVWFGLGLMAPLGSCP
ncbi:hypothetical protein IEQ34_020207 [Dendrobium chrysotoxum]|uniref:Uncharacterized protein n=1 Tax=Dendrobium chrysotoxum TaxID=161865 RepID=A0AAV7G095_DENCH|nr:hypothetical protein IEQ34_020207 [Dendrobium chrysotoxum]